MADRVVTIAKDTDRDNLKAAYQQAIADLQAIQKETAWTNAKVIAAVVNLAGIQEKLLKYRQRKINT